jgi:hypothetical protein
VLSNNNGNNRDGILPPIAHRAQREALHNQPGGKTFLHHILPFVSFAFFVVAIPSS